MRACVLVGVSACMRTHDIHVHDMHEYVYVCGTRAVLKHDSSPSKKSSQSSCLSQVPRHWSTCARLRCIGHRNSNSDNGISNVHPFLQFSLSSCLGAVASVAGVAVFLDGPKPVAQNARNDGMILVIFPAQARHFLHIWLTLWRAFDETQGQRRLLQNGKRV